MHVDMGRRHSFRKQYRPGRSLDDRGHETTHPKRHLESRPKTGQAEVAEVREPGMHYHPDTHTPSHIEAGIRGRKRGTRRLGSSTHHSSTF